MRCRVSYSCGSVYVSNTRLTSDRPPLSNTVGFHSHPWTHLANQKNSLLWTDCNWIIQRFNLNKHSVEKRLYAACCVDGWNTERCPCLITHDVDATCIDFKVTVISYFLIFPSLIVNLSNCLRNKASFCTAMQSVWATHWVEAPPGGRL